MKKIVNVSFLKPKIAAFKKNGQKIVFTNGCFDLLHPGHLRILNTAKKSGNILIVGLNSDSSIKKIKGKSRPIFKEKARATVLEGIAAVDYVVIFRQNTPYALIKAIRPDILVKGDDWKKEKIIGSDLVKKVIRVKNLPGYSTSNIIKRIQKDAR